MKHTADGWVDNGMFWPQCLSVVPVGLESVSMLMTVFFFTRIHHSLLLLSWKWPYLARRFVEWHLGRGRLGVGPRKLISTAKETTVSPVPGPGLPCTSKTPAHNSGHFLLLSSQCHWLLVSLYVSTFQLWVVLESEKKALGSTHRSI